MKQDSGYLSVLIGVIMLSIVTLTSGGIAYSFYRSETAPEEESSSELTKKNDFLQELETEKNIVPIPKQTDGSRGMDFSQEGIPTGTYSNPPAGISSFGDSYSTEINRPLDNFDSAVENNRNRFDRNNIGNNIPDYSNPSLSNNFNQTSDNSLLKPLDDSDFLEIPHNNSRNSSETPPLTESPL